MKGFPLPKGPKLELNHQMQLSATPRTRWSWRVLPRRRDKVGLFYSPRRQGWKCIKTVDKKIYWLCFFIWCVIYCRNHLCSRTALIPIAEGDKWLHAFRKDMSLNVSQTAQWEFELTYLETAAKHFTHYTTGDSPHPSPTAQPSWLRL